MILKPFSRLFKKKIEYNYYDWFCKEDSSRYISTIFLKIDRFPRWLQIENSTILHRIIRLPVISKIFEIPRDKILRFSRIFEYSKILKKEKITKEQFCWKAAKEVKKWRKIDGKFLNLKLISPLRLNEEENQLWAIISPLPSGGNEFGGTSRLTGSSSYPSLRRCKGGKPLPCVQTARR